MYVYVDACINKYNNDADDDTNKILWVLQVFLVFSIFQCLKI